MCSRIRPSFSHRDASCARVRIGRDRSAAAPRESRSRPSDQQQLFLLVIRNISDIFLQRDLGRRQGLSVQGGSHVSTRRSPWSHQSPSMRGLSGLNPRNIHTGAPTRYYRGIIQTYLYPTVR